MNSPAAISARTAGTWPARLDLRIGRRGDSSRLRRCRHSGPLYVQRAFYPEGEDLAHLYLLHPPGGVVSGDALQIGVVCEAGSRALITTPGAGRIYRARDTLPQQSQQAKLRVAEGGSLEWFPLETIVYDGACVDLTTDVQLAAGSHFISWEVTCFGLPASNAPFARGSFRQRYRIHRDGVPVFVDGFEVDEHSREALLHGPAALRGHTVTGLFVAGPFPDNRERLHDLLERCRGKAGSPAEVVHASCGNPLRGRSTQHVAISLVGDMLVGRYLGDSAEGARRHFSHWWRLLRPLLLNREACAPRIWLT